MLMTDVEAVCFDQDIDPKRLLQGNDALFNVQVTYCGNNQTALGITMAHVMSGSYHSFAAAATAYIIKRVCAIAM